MFYFYFFVVQVYLYEKLASFLLMAFASMCLKVIIIIKEFVLNFSDLRAAYIHITPTALNLLVMISPRPQSRLINYQLFSAY